MDKHALAAVVLILLALAPHAPAAAPAAEPVNLVANGDFSQATGGKPDQWEAAGDSATVTQTLEAARDAEGRPFARLACTRFDPRGPSSHAMLAQTGSVRLAKGRLYEFSCRVRAEGLRGRAVSVAISSTRTWTNCGLQADLPVGREWKTRRALFTATEDVGPSGRLQIWFTETGTLEVADVRIVETRPQEVEFTDAVLAAGGKNLVPNGSFEVGPSGWSTLGERVGWGSLSRLHGHIESGDAPHGRSFLRIPLGRDKTPVLQFDYYEPVVRRELRPLAAGRGWIKVVQGATYTLSCTMRASRDGVRAALGVRAADPPGGWRDLVQPVTLTTAWKRYAFAFQPQRGYVYVLAGPALEKEDEVDVDIDAVQLERGGQATAFEPRTEVEFAIEPTAEAGLFVEGEPAALHVTACNHGAAAAQASLTFKVTDFFDRDVPLRDHTMEVPPQTVAECNLEIPPAWKGFYRVHAQAQTGKAGESVDVRLAVLPPRTSTDSVLGINHAFATADLVRLASKAGVTWYRDWSLKWQHMEPEKDRFDWPRGDAQIDRVLKEGARVLCLLPPFPSADWSSEAPADLPKTGYPGIRLRQAWAPKDPAELGRFVGQAVDRYKDRLHVWEFLNEPIYTDYALPADEGKRYGGRKYGPADYVALLVGQAVARYKDRLHVWEFMNKPIYMDYALPADTGNRYGGRKYGPADYVALLKVAAAAMKQADPACKVMGGIGGGPLLLTREVIEAGGLDHLDLFNLHFYPGSRRPESYAPEMDQLLALMESHGGRKPIWVTEFSYYGADDLPRRPFFPHAGSWSEQRLLESERQCADLTVRFFAVMLARGVEKIFIHSGSSGEVNAPDFECALLAYGGAPRKALAALAVLTELLGPAPRCEGTRTLGESGHAVAFRTDRHAVVVLWSADEETPGAVTAPMPPGVTLLDAMGRSLPPDKADLGASPMYLVGPAGMAKQLLDEVQYQAPAP